MAIVGFGSGFGNLPNLPRFVSSSRKQGQHYLPFKGLEFNKS